MECGTAPRGGAAISFITATVTNLNRGFIQRYHTPRIDLPKLPNNVVWFQEPLFRLSDGWFFYFSFSESYFAVKGAALILPQSEFPRTASKPSNGGQSVRLSVWHSCGRGIFFPVKTLATFPYLQKLK